MPVETIVHVKHLSLVRSFIGVWSKQHAQRGREGKTGEGEGGGGRGREPSKCKIVTTRSTIGNSISLLNSIIWQVETSACIAGCLSCTSITSLDP